MIVAGIGCRKGAPAADISAVIAHALAHAGLAREALDLVAAPESKADELGVSAAAAELGVPLVLVSRADLQAAGARTQTRSERVLALIGVPSVAEAAALAASGPASRLIVPRMSVGIATCALAAGKERT
jgi:cobalt-precorrin 5A hydrolase